MAQKVPEPFVIGVTDEIYNACLKYANTIRGRWDNKIIELELVQEDVILLKKLETAVIANINKITVDSMEYRLKKDILDCIKNILEKKLVANEG